MHYIGWQSNNLDIGGEALIKAGLDPYEKTGEPFSGGESPVGIAKSSRAIQFLMMLQRLALYD